MLQYFTSYNDVKELKEGNIAVTISFGGAIIAVSLLVANVLSQVQVFNLDSIMLLITYSIISFIFLLILPGLLTKYLVSKMVMNESTIDDFIKSGNLDIAILQAIVKVIFALVVVYAIPFNLF